MTRRIALSTCALAASLTASLVAGAPAQACDDADGDGYGVYPETSKLAGCSNDGIDCDDGDPAVHPFAKEICGNGKDDNCRHGADEGCGGEAAPFDGWRVMPVRSQGEHDRGEPGGRAEQFQQGAARCIADPDVIYLSHDCSTIWRSRDGGQTWHKPLALGLWLAHGQSIEVDPVDCDRVLVVADAAYDYKNPGFTGIYLSEDGGEHFELVQKGPTLHSRRYEHDVAFARASADAQGARTWYAALYNEPSEATHEASALFRSDDRGKTWKAGASLADHHPVYEVHVSPSDSEVVLVASGSGLLRSGDGGATLVSAGELPAGEVTSVALSPSDAKVVFAVVRGATKKGLYRSGDGGKSFSRVTVADAAHQAVLDDARRVFVHPTDGDVLYVLPQSATGGRGAIRSDDGGASFTATSFSLPDDVKAWRWGIGFAGGFSFLLPSASDSHDVVGQSRGAALYRSTDGEVFENGSALYTGANCAGQNYAIAFDPDDPQRLAIAHQDIGMYLTENGGDWFVSRGVPHAWVDQGKIAWSSQWTIDLHPGQPDQLVSAVGRSFDRKVVRTTDAGKTWTISDDTAGKYFRVVYHPFDPKLVFAGKRRSTDGGASFAPLSLPAELVDADLQVLDFCRAQPDVIYAASAKSRRILRSVDKGNSWSLYVKAGGSIAPFDSYITFAVDPARCDVIYTLDSEGDLARYDGASWTSLGVMAKVNAPDGYFTFVRAVQVDPNHPEVIYAGTFGSGLPALLRSTDGGQSWEDVSLNRFRGGVSGINISPHSGEVLVGSCSGTWVLPPAYPTNHRIYDKLVPRPSCLDGIKNGEEGGIDCGGGCPQACAGGGDGGGPGPGGDGTVAPTSDAGAGGDGGGGDGGNTDPAADGGCGCRTDGRGGTGSSLLALLALLAACSARPRPAESLTPSPTQEEGISVFFQRRKAARVRDKSATKGGTQ